ncbi:sensor histidine kinase [Methylomonas methanica]|uniref:histidine kinase n=1 Tax=Methylomonas methanica (strain DSM 25384 / MC09) TaxID=857087 RepID=F9ZXH7_METMM|nr:HAMP domain-containing sensor histidine kinase [Methylomonas methanica]AEG00965.1 integral membrane sensor signal transduction histidine kinase [Methylomonas methanica MC09]
MGRLFWKFFFASWLAMLAAGAGVGTAVWWSHQTLEQERHAQKTLDLDHHAGLFVGAAADVLQFGGEQALSQYLQQARHHPAPQVYAVDARGTDILQRAVEPQLLNQARDWYLQQDDGDEIRKVRTVEGREFLLFAVIPEFTRGRHSGPLPPIPPHWRDAPPPKRPSLWLPVISGTFASLCLSAALAWYFAKPIRSLRKAFADAAVGRLDTQVAEAMGNRHDELTDLGQDFDHMAAQLDSLISAQQRLLHDVSHELRSPLARMQAAIGLAQQQPHKIPETLERIERESQRISDLVGELLVLSRLEAGVSDGNMADTDLGGLLADIVEDVRFEAAQKQVEITYRGFDEVIVETSGELLHRAVENVLRNAVQHCKCGGEVTVNAGFDPAEGRLRIVIEDQGIGVPEADLQAIFQPFFKSPNQKKPDSVGLGLSIAYRAVEALGGNIRARNRSQGGLAVEIELRLLGAGAGG